MDENIMNNEIGQAISKYPQSDGKTRRKPKVAPTDKTPDAYKRIEKEKIIISFPPTFVFFVVMIFMQFP